MFERVFTFGVALGRFILQGWLRAVGWCWNNSALFCVSFQILGTLGTENSRPSAAAQCVAYVAVAELPAKQWPDLITQLVNNVLGQASTEMLRESSLEAIGYICQEIVSIQKLPFRDSEARRKFDSWNFLPIFLRR